MVFVHDRLTKNELIGFVARGLVETEDGADQRLREFIESVDETHPRDAFASFNATLKPSDRFERIGQLSEPVPADVYRAPAELACIV